MFKLEKIQFLPATAPNAKEPLICRACCAAGGICRPVPVKQETGLKVLIMFTSRKASFLGGLLPKVTSLKEFTSRTLCKSCN